MSWRELERFRDARVPKLDHLRRNIAAANCGPLPATVLERIDRAWRAVGADWPAST